MIVLRSPIRLNTNVRSGMVIHSRRKSSLSQARKNTGVSAFIHTCKFLSGKAEKATTKLSHTRKQTQTAVQFSWQMKGLKINHERYKFLFSRRPPALVAAGGVSKCAAHLQLRSKFQHLPVIVVFFFEVPLYDLAMSIPIEHTALIQSAGFT